MPTPGAGHDAPSTPEETYVPPAEETASESPAAHDGPADMPSPADAHGGAQVAADQSATQPTSTAGWLGSLFGVGGPPPATPGAMPTADGDYVPPTEGGETTTDSPAGEGGTPSYPPEAVQQFAEGTAEHAIQQVALKMAVGDQTGMEKYISEKARGSLLKFRTGQADAVDVGEAKQAMIGVTPVSIRSTSDGKSVILRNPAGQIITFTAKREDAGYRVTNMKIEMARGRR